MDFAFLGRVSTGDAQNPEQSRLWQLRLAQQLLAPAGHRITCEFFDIGQSRSVPWRRRPEASALLTEMARRDRRFDAVVIGEPHRAFYGSQFQLTFPLLVHYGVELWVPEVGGRVDPDSEAHDIMMSLFGGMSKGERARIRKRTKTAMHALAQQVTTHLGGRPPYGYQLVDAGPHANRSLAASGARAHTLAVDEATGSVVRRIFAMRAAGAGYGRIAATLTNEGIPSPSRADPARNAHRDGLAWSASTVRAILLNPTYTGVRVWAKQEKFERLTDIDDIALGYETGMRRRDPSTWIVPDTPTHPALVSADLFAKVQPRAETAATSPRRTYPLSGRLRCAHCGNQMRPTFTRTNTGTDRGRAYYRCETGKHTSPPDGHPTTCIVNQAKIVAALDAELARLFDEPESLIATLDHAGAPNAEARAVHAAIAEISDELARWAEMDASHLPAIAVERQRVLQAQRDQLRARVRLARAPDRRQLEADASGALREAGALVDSLRNASDEQRRAVYAALDLRLTYDALGATAAASFTPYVGGSSSQRRPVSGPAATTVRYSFTIELPRAGQTRRPSRTGPTTRT